MSKWRVWNKHPDGITHKEKFRDELVEIPAGKYILMDYEDAVHFKGQYFHMKMDAQGAPSRETWKMIFLEPHDETQTQPAITKYICHVDRKEFSTQAELDAYEKANFSDRVFKDETLDEEIDKRKPGRPRKETHAP